MAPTYYGMTPYVYNAGVESPGAIDRLGRFALKGASHYSFKAPENGEVFIELNSREALSKSGEIFKNEIRPTRWLGILPSTERVYFLRSGDRRIEISIPVDFSLNQVMPKAYAFGSQSPDVVPYYHAIAASGKARQSGADTLLSLGEFKKGERILEFDILAGDMLIVDRFTYNFRNPKVGEPIVFKTGSIEGMKKYSEGDKYYIKRLVG
jgi:hypothetical protein